MDGDLAAQAITTSNSNAQVVLNGAIFNLTSLTGEGDKGDFVTDKFDPVTAARLLPDGGVPSGVVLDTSSGLVLSVGDAITVGQASLGSVISGSQIDLQSTGLSASQLLSQADLGGDGVTPQLIEVHSNPADAQGLSGAKVEELSLVTQNAVVGPVMVSGTQAHHAPTVVGLHIVTGTVEEEPRKKRGGWPKGKKRKKEPLTNPPRAPATGYVLYAMQRRIQIKESNPTLPFVEITKLLGSEWSAMSTEERQKYMDLAEADKKRYIEELKAYQQSDAYKEFVRRKKMKEDEPTGVDSIDNYQDLEEEGLYCKVCDQYFSTIHNRKEHIFGRQHLQNMTSEFEKELQKQQSAESEGFSSDISNMLSTSGSEQSPIGANYAQCGESPLGVNEFIQEFLAKNYEREAEIRELRKSVESAKEIQLKLTCQIRELKEIHHKLEHDVGTLKPLGASLAAQIDGLRMVPTLFGVINF